MLPEAGAGHIREGNWRRSKNDYRKHICRDAKELHELRSRVAVAQEPLAGARRHSSHEGLLKRGCASGYALRAVQEHADFIRMLEPYTSQPMRSIDGEGHASKCEAAWRRRGPPWGSSSLFKRGRRRCVAHSARPSDPTPDIFRRAFRCLQGLSRCCAQKVVTRSRLGD